MSWKTKFEKVTALTHSEQAIWWLNGFWEEGAKDYAEEMWGITHKFIETQIDGPVLYGSRTQQYTEEDALDEFKSHRILEILGETMTVVALRKRLAELDIDKNKRMAISEYLLDKYKKTPEALVNSPQGDVDPAELAAAVAACDNASNLLDQASSDAEAASAAVLASTLAAAAAVTALASAQEAEALVKAAEAELQVVVDEINALEQAKVDKIAKCQAIIDDGSAGAVKKGRAVQEKEQTLSEDPLPLRKAKITQGAALKRVTKARVKAEEQTAAADEADRIAKQAAADAVVAKDVADRAKVAAEAAFEEAQAALEDLKAKGTGSPQGKLWWMSRILQEKKKFTK